MKLGGFQRFGNDLYTGARSVPFIGKRRIWLSIAALMVLAAIFVPFARGGGNFAEGFNFGIEFRGGSQFIVSGTESGKNGSIDPSLATTAVHSVVPHAVVKVAIVGTDGVRVQTDQLTALQTREVTNELKRVYNTDQVSSSFIGATWGADITQNALRGLGVFLLFAAVLMAIYFRTWKMSAAAILALMHDLIVCIGVYALTGFEITPAAVIGFLTILGYSLYDTVVVFDKIRENTSELGDESNRTFGEMVNLAVNQTLVRSINTGVVAALPVAAILFIGAYILGADTLRDISLALLVGTILGTYSTPFVAAPLYVQFRHNESEIRKRDKRVLSLRAKSEAKVAATV